MLCGFNPRTPCGVRPVKFDIQLVKQGFNPRTPCGVRQGAGVRTRRRGDVSIHALLAECDACGRRRPPRENRFNPRTPCGVRRGGFDFAAGGDEFQSTHSLRSATADQTLQPINNMFQSTHSLRSATPWRITGTESARCFNPRTPCGVRHQRPCQGPHALRFQSTHSLRSATGHRSRGSHDSPGFNPRTPCGVRLVPRLEQIAYRKLCFNPRTPCGVRRLSDVTQMLDKWFQSTHSLRSATHSAAQAAGNMAVSIHALLAECDGDRPYTLLLNRANHTLRQPP